MLAAMLLACGAADARSARPAAGFACARIRSRARESAGSESTARTGARVDSGDGAGDSDGPGKGRPRTLAHFCSAAVLGRILFPHFSEDGAQALEPRAQG